MVRFHYERAFKQNKEQGRNQSYKKLIQKSKGKKPYIFSDVYFKKDIKSGRRKSICYSNREYKHQGVGRFPKKERLQLYPLSSKESFELFDNLIKEEKIYNRKSWRPKIKSTFNKSKIKKTATRILFEELCLDGISFDTFRSLYKENLVKDFLKTGTQTLAALKKDCDDSKLKKIIVQQIKNDQGLQSQRCMVETINSSFSLPGKKLTRYKLRKLMKEINYKFKRVKKDKKKVGQNEQIEKELEFACHFAYLLKKGKMPIFIDETGFEESMIPLKGWALKDEELRIPARNKSKLRSTKRNPC